MDSLEYERHFLEMLFETFPLHDGLISFLLFYLFNLSSRNSFFFQMWFIMHYNWLVLVSIEVFQMKHENPQFIVWNNKKLLRIWVISNLVSTKSDTMWNCPSCGVNDQITVGKLRDYCTFASSSLRWFQIIDNLLNAISHQCRLPCCFILALKTNLHQFLLTCRLS